MDRPFVTRLAAAAAVAIFALGATILRASADTGTDLTLPVGSAPVVRVAMPAGRLIVGTWNRASVHVTVTGGMVDARHFDATAVQRALHGGEIPIFATTVQTPRGPLTLPSEVFAVASLASGAHDGVLIRGRAGETVHLTVPADTAFLWATVARGRIGIANFHGGSFVARVQQGGIALQNVSGQGYVQVARGPILIRRSAFQSIRARTAAGSIIFRSCSAQQIEVSSINGSILYDNGTFAPGLARFESKNGNVALGIARGGVQIGAHSTSGRIFENFGTGAAAVKGTATDAQAILAGGGPVVTASSGRGAVFLYNGRLKAQPQMRRRWRPIGRRGAHPGRRIRRFLKKKPAQYRHVQLKRVLR